MNFANTFVPVAANVGLLPMITYYILFASQFAFLGGFIWFVMNRDRIVPEHRDSLVFSAIIVGVAGVSYFFIRSMYLSMLTELSNTAAPAAQARLIQDSFLAIGQFRYIDWLITTPLLLLKTVMSLRIKPAKAAGAITLLLLADVFMIITGYIGEQQFTANGAVQAGPLYFWGFISTIGYVIIPLTLYGLYRRFQADAQPEERTAFKILAFATVTTWGVYPIGYMLPVLAPGLSLNWVHIAFTVFDVINKVGAGVVMYIAAARLTERLVPEERVQRERSLA